jgi:hypothetical protein
MTTKQADKGAGGGAYGPEKLINVAFYALTQPYRIKSYAKLPLNVTFCTVGVGYRTKRDASPHRNAETSQFPHYHQATAGDVAYNRLKHHKARTTVVIVRAL